MPMDTLHTLQGTLRWTGQGYRLDVEDGGHWILDVSRRAKHLVGHRVSVEGKRSGFNLIDVTRITQKNPDVRANQR